MDEISPNAVGLWALLFLSENDRIKVREFFAYDWNIDRRFVLREMHISVYHAQREMPGIGSIVEPVRIILPAAETRFMTFAPGGIEPTPDIIPSEKKVGIRVHGKSTALPAILALRKRLLAHESAEMLGERFPAPCEKALLDDAILSLTWRSYVLEAVSLPICALLALRFGRNSAN